MGDMNDLTDGTTESEQGAIARESSAGGVVEDLRLLLMGVRDSISRNGKRRSIEDVDPWPEVPEAIADHPTRIEVLEDVRESFEDEPFEGVSVIEDEPSAELLERGFFDFSYLTQYEEIERYWVNRPFAYVSMVADDEGEVYYHVTEPVLSEFEQFVFDELTKILRNSLMYQDVTSQADKESTFLARSKELIDRHTAALRPLAVHKLLYYLSRNFLHYDRVDPVMRDANVEDISCDGVGVPVFVYHRDYRDLETNVEYQEGELTSFVARMAQRAGKHVSVSNPLVDASLPDGSRVQLSFGGDVSTRGPNFTVRQFSSVPDTPIDLINWDTFSLEQMAYFWLAIENNRSLIFAGGTGSGKTTSLNAVSFFIPKKSKVVSIEDTREITLPHQNWIQSLTRESASAGGSSITMYDQLQTALRQRPEYLLVGEIRTQQQVALTFFQAMATGHTAYTTLHSESVTGVINRLENEPLGVPTEMLKELDIISIQKQVLLADERVRRTERVAELIGGEGDELRVNDVFEWDPGSDTFNTDFDSRVLKDIADDRGWGRAELQQELDRRKEVLNYLLDNDITWWEDVARVIHRFMADQDAVIEEIRRGTPDPEEV